MLRISDVRMSGTAFDTIISMFLPKRPWVARWRCCKPTIGPGILVRDKKIELLFDSTELERRRAAWSPTIVPP